MAKEQQAAPPDLQPLLDTRKPDQSTGRGGAILIPVEDWGLPRAANFSEIREGAITRGLRRRLKAWLALRPRWVATKHGHLTPTISALLSLLVFDDAATGSVLRSSGQVLTCCLLHAVVRACVRTLTPQRLAG